MFCHPNDSVGSVPALTLAAKVREGPTVMHFIPKRIWRLLFTDYLIFINSRNLNIRLKVVISEVTGIHVVVMSPA